MKLTRTTLYQFRNIRQLQQDNWGQYNVILGDNGQGKTNLLEALYLLSHTRSFRTPHERDLIQLHAEDGLRLSATVEREGLYRSPLHLEARFSWQANSRHHTQSVFLLNQQPVRTRSELLGKLSTVTFTVDELNLLRDGPAQRRQWLNTALCQHTPACIRSNQQLKQVFAQKQALLKQAPYDATLQTLPLLEVYNQQLAPLMAQVVYERLQYLALLEPYFQAAYHPLCQGRELLPWLQYFPIQLAQLPLSQISQTETQRFPTRLNEASNLSLEQLTHAYGLRLEQLAPNELRRKQALLGPHRDDWCVWMNEHHEAHKFASQGQQRSMALALKLAELALLTEQLQEAPILLLDDVLAELDEKRQLALLQALPTQAQVFLTTPHLDALHQWEGLFSEAPLSCFRMNEGQLTPWLKP